MIPCIDSSFELNKSILFHWGTGNVQKIHIRPYPLGKHFNMRARTHKIFGCPENVDIVLALFAFIEMSYLTKQGIRLQYWTENFSCRTKIKKSRFFASFKSGFLPLMNAIRKRSKRHISHACARLQT